MSEPSDASLMCTVCGHWIIWSGSRPPKRGMCSCNLDDGSAESILAQEARHQRELEGHVHIEVRTAAPFKPDAIFAMVNGTLRRVDEGEVLDLHARAPESFAGIKATFELALDPFERIELAAAAWRNAYRAHERRDREAVERHLREAIDHGVQLIRGLYG